MGLEKIQITALSDMIVNHLWNCPPDELSQYNCGSLAKALRMHPVVLSRRFSRERGKTLIAVLREIKVARAVKMLHEETVGSVKEAMAVAGYRDRKYFNTLVRKMFGENPADLDLNEKWLPRSGVSG